MPRAIVADILEKFNEPEHGLRSRRSEAEILIVAPGILIIKVDVKQLSSLPCLGDSVYEVEPGHVLVCNFGIHADHFRMIESRDESKISAGAGHIDVPARLIRLGFESKLESIFLVDAVLAKIIDGLSQILQRLIWTAAGIGLRAFTPAPEHKDFRSEFSPEVHGA